MNEAHLKCPRTGHGLAIRVRRAQVRLLHWPVILPLLLSCFVFRAWLLPGLISANDFPSFSEPVIRGGAFGWPHLWTDLNFGLSLLYWCSNLPIWSLDAPLHAVGASFNLVERIIWLWPFMVGGPICGYYLCYRFTRNQYAAAIGASLFTINTWSIGLVERGHIPSLDAFVLFGLVLPRIIDFTARPSRRVAIVLAFLISFQLAYDLRYGYEALLVLTLISVSALPRLIRRVGFSSLARTSLSFAAAMIVFNLHVILPTLVAPHAPPGWGSADVFTGTSHFGSLLSSFSLYYPWYHYVPGVDGFAETPVELPFIICALVAWVGLLMTSSRRSSRVFLLITMVGIILVSGTKSPFAQFNIALFLHFPEFALFRDFLKFNGLIVPQYAVGVALAFTTLITVARRRVPRAGGAQPLLAVLVMIGYLCVMRDALNPLRMTNFAQVPRLSEAANATEQFLRRGLGDGRYMMFPNDLRWGRREDRYIPAAIAGSFVANPPPEGLAALNPGLGGNDLFFQMFSSPLAPALLRELRVRYIIVPEDPELYYSYSGLPQRWASVDFFRQQQWLREVAQFGRNIVFELRNSRTPTAFFAPYPTLVIGSPATLEGLTGLPLWSDRAAVLMYQQMPDADWIGSIPNLVEGPSLIDPHFTIAKDGAFVEAQLLGKAISSERYRRRPFSAWVFSSSMLSRSMQKWNLESSFAFRFQTNSRANSKVALLLEPRKNAPGIVQKNGDVQVGGAAPDGSAISCGHSAAFEGQFSANLAQIYLPDESVGQQLYVYNPCPAAYSGSINFRATSGDNFPLSFSVSSGEGRSAYTAPPAWLDVSGSGNFILQNVPLRAGLNAFSINKPAGRTLSLNSAYSVSDLHRIKGSFEPLSLRLSVRRSEPGDLVYASIDAPRPGQYVGYLQLFGALNIALDRRPLCTFKFDKATVPVDLDLVLKLRNRNSGKETSLWIPITQEIVDYDIREAVRDAMRRNFEDEVSYHADDPLWTKQHFAEGPSSPDDFTLLDVRIAAIWSVAESSDVPHGTLIALVRGIRLATNEPELGSDWTYPETYSISTAQFSEKNFSVRGMKLLRIEKTGGSNGDLAVQAIGFAPSGYRLTTGLHVGDYVQLTLQSDRKAQGTIVAQSSEYVLLQDGEAPPQRISVGSISAINQQEVTRRIQITIPVVAPFRPTAMSFALRSDETLKVRMGLVYESPDGSRESIPAVYRAETDKSRASIEPDFIKPALFGAAALFDLSVPIDLSVASTPSTRLNSYDLDLWNIERYRFGGTRRRLVGLALEFTESQASAPVNRQYAVAISNVKVSRDRWSSNGVVSAISNAPLLVLDGKPLRATKFRMFHESKRYSIGEISTGTLESGNHVILSRALDELKIRTATVWQGSPKTYHGGEVHEFYRFTPSEIRGAFSGSGVLVIPQTYDGGWQLALWPSGLKPPQLTGFALADFFRGRKYALPQNYHVPVNTYVDAWYIPPGGGEQRFTMLYVPEAFNELGMLLTLLLALPLWIYWRRV